MSNKLPVWETIVTAILLIVAGFGIGTTVQKRVDKGSGELTLSNYTDYLQVSGGVNSGTGAGSTATYSYTVFVSAHENYAIRDLVLSYTLTGGGTSVSSDLQTDLSAGEMYTEMGSVQSDAPLDLSSMRDFKIIVTAISGVYEYAV